MIVVFPPGGSNDVVARIVFQKMSETLGQQFVIDNRGGAAGTIGAEIVAKSPPDGYTLMVQSATHVANAHLYKNLPYDTLGDFIGITTLARQVGMLVVHPSMPVKTTKEFIALAKKRPGEIVYGSAGNGSYLHLAMALAQLHDGDEDDTRALQGRRSRQHRHRVRGDPVGYRHHRIGHTQHQSGARASASQ